MGSKEFRRLDNVTALVPQIVMEILTVSQDVLQRIVEQIVK